MIIKKGKNLSWRNPWAQNLDGSYGDMTIAAEIRGTTLRLRDVLALQRGDVVPLTRRFDAVLDLTVDGIPRYQGYVALNANNKRVFQVTGLREEN